MIAGLIYLGIFVFSAIFAFFAFIFGHDTDHDVSADHDVGHDAGGDADGIPSIFSSRVISLFLLGFSGTGLVTTFTLEWPPIASASAGLGSGIVLGGVAWLLVFIFYREQATSSANPADYVGLEGRVASNIPAGGTGEVTLTVKEQLRTVFATSADGKPIPEGRQVRVEKMAGGTATVRLVDKK